VDEGFLVYICFDLSFLCSTTSYIIPCLWSIINSKEPTIYEKVKYDMYSAWFHPRVSVNFLHLGSISLHGLIIYQSVSHDGLN
jgi:hypothetical protein